MGLTGRVINWSTGVTATSQARFIVTAGEAVSHFRLR